MSGEREPIYLTPVECAEYLSVTSEFIRGEVHDQRLPARVFTRPSGRRVYRIGKLEFAAYVAQRWPFHVKENTTQPIEPIHRKAG